MLNKVVRFTVVAVLFVSLVSFTGCSKAKNSGGAQTPGVTSSEKGGGSGNIKDIMSKQKGVSSYTMTMDASGQKMTQSIKLSDGKPMRMRMEMGGQVMIMQMDKKIHYMYNPATKTAMKMEMKGEGMMGSVDKSKMPKDLKLDTLQKPVITSDKLDGMDCWKIASEYNGAKSDVWVDKEYGLPRQEQSGDKVMKISYTNINSVPDSEFELPAGTKIQDMSEMMKGMHNMPNMPMAMPKH